MPYYQGILQSVSGGTSVSNAGTLTNASNTTITGGGTLALAGFTLTVPATGTAALLATANVFTAAQAIAINDAGTATTTTLATFTHNSTGTPAASFGSRLLFNLDSATVDDRNAAAMDVIWTTATDASRTANLVFQVAINGTLTEKLRVTNTGITSGWITENSTGVFLSTGLPILSNGDTTLWAGNGGTVIQSCASNVAPTNAISTLFEYNIPQSSATSAGFGGGVKYTLKDSTTARTLAAATTWEWVVATHASRTARVVHSVYDTATREGFRIEASGSAAMIGFLGAGASARQTGGENITNSVTSGGVDGTITNWTDLTTYATDAAAIRNAVYQLARAVKQDHDSLRLYGLLT